MLMVKVAVHWKPLKIPKMHIILRCSSPTHTLHVVQTKGRSDVPCMNSYKFREVEFLLAEHRLDAPSI